MKELTDEEKNLANMAKTTNYNKWQYEIIKKYVGNRVLEVGGGIGNMTKFFLNKEEVLSVDISKYNVIQLSKKYSDKNNFSAARMDISDVHESFTSILNGHFDTVFCSNVLEHIKYDMKAVTHMCDMLQDNGKLILIVPAFQSLYGTVDEAVNHYRRYNRKSLSLIVRVAGMRVVKCFYMNLPGFFGWYYNNKIIKTRVNPESSLSLFDKLVPFIAFFERMIHPPFGLSVVLIAEKVKK